MWIWSKSREAYYCRDCQQEVKWSKITRQGFCNCMIFKSNEYLGILPPGCLDGEFTKNSEGVEVNGAE